MEGLVRVAAVTAPTKPGDIRANCDAFLQSVSAVDEMRPDIVLLPGGALGASYMGTAKNRHVWSTARQEAERFASEVSDKEALYVLCAPGKTGPVCHLISGGEIVQTVSAVYEMWENLTCFKVDDTAVALLFCDPAELSRYSAEILSSGADIVLIPADFPAQIGRDKRVLRQMREVSEALDIAVVVCQNTGASAPTISTPMTAVYECGELLCLGETETPLSVVDIDTDITNMRRPKQVGDFLFHRDARSGAKSCMRPLDRYPLVPKGDDACMELFDLQVRSLSARMENTGIHKLVLGVSGGLDSTLALLVAAGACDRLGLSRQNITAITMPGFGTSGRTYENALGLIDAVGAQFQEIPIADSVIQHFKDIGHDPENRDVVYENAQARERTQILLDIANAVGGLVVGTGDMSEAALGFCTFGGDALANFNVNICLSKTAVRRVCRAIKGQFVRAERYIEDILDTPVSPELLPPGEGGEIAQKTEEILGDYALLDFYLYHHLRGGLPPQKVYYYACAAFADSFSAGYMKEKLVLFYRRYFSSAFKRAAAPEWADIGAVSFVEMPGDLSGRDFIRAAQEIVSVD